jgi:hypothetical protein
MVGGSKKLLETNLICVVRRVLPRIYENSIFPAYVPEKNKIITPWTYGKNNSE